MGLLYNYCIEEVIGILDLSHEELQTLGDQLGDDIDVLVSMREVVQERANDADEDIEDTFEEYADMTDREALLRQIQDKVRKEVET